MKKYEVTNPCLSFRIPETKKDYNLIEGETVELPEMSNVTRALLARGQIKEVETVPMEETTTKKK